MRTDGRQETVQVVEAYGDGSFRISGTVHQGSVVIVERVTHAWPAGALDDAARDHFKPIFTVEPAVEILLLGCGKAVGEAPAFLIEDCRAAGIAVEPLDTGAAARTFNLLASEGRRVAAALIAV